MTRLWSLVAFAYKRVQSDLAMAGEDAQVPRASSATARPVEPVPADFEETQVEDGPI